MSSEALTLKTLGNTHYQKKDFDSALKCYQAAFEKDPTEMTYKLNCGAVYFEQGAFQECVGVCMEAVEVGRSNRADFKLIAKAFSRAGNAYYKLGDLLNAKTMLEKSLSEHRTPSTKTQLVSIEKEIKEKERLSYLNPKLAEEEKEKGNEAFKKGDFAAALKYYSEAIKRLDENEGRMELARVYSNRAAAYTKVAEFDLGLKDCNTCLVLDPTFIKGYLRKGKILLVLKESSKALVCYEKALELDANNQEAIEGVRAAWQAQRGDDNDDDSRRKKAMSDPEVVGILQDPAMRLILEQMQSDPKALQEHLKNPHIAEKIQKLIESGIVQIK